MRLTAYADDLAAILANLWMDLPGIVACFARWALASGLGLSVAKCILVPLWDYSQDEVANWLRAACPSFASCAVAASARYLGVEIGPGASVKQWASVSAKLLRRTGDIVAAGEALGTRLVQYRVYGMSLVLYRAQFAEVDWRILEAHRKAQQRLCFAPWMAYPPRLARGVAGFGVCVEGSRSSPGGDCGPPPLGLHVAGIRLLPC